LRIETSEAVPVRLDFEPVYGTVDYGEVDSHFATLQAEFLDQDGVDLVGVTS
jgi:hypothetical protein